MKPEVRCSVRTALQWHISLLCSAYLVCVCVYVFCFFHAPLAMYAYLPRYRNKCHINKNKIK